MTLGSGPSTIEADHDRRDDEELGEQQHHGEQGDAVIDIQDRRAQHQLEQYGSATI
jgi:hypothetical protein